MIEFVEEHHHHSADMKSRSSGLDEEPSPVKSQSSRALPVMKGVFPRGAVRGRGGGRGGGGLVSTRTDCNEGCVASWRC